MLVGLKDGGKVYIAYSYHDSFLTMPACDMILPDNICVWKVKGAAHTLVAFPDVCAQGQALRFFPKLFCGDITFDRIVLGIAPAMDGLFEKIPYIADRRVERCDCFIAQSDKLYVVNSSRVVLDIKSEFAVGIGDDIALSVLFATKGEPPVQRLKKVFAAISEFKRYETFPFILTDTGSCKTKIISK